MNVTSRALIVTQMLALGVAWPATLGAQEQPAGRGEAEAARAVARLVAEPASLTLVAGQTATLKITAYDAQGNVVADAPVRISGERGALFVNRSTREVRALKAGKYEIVASTATRALERAKGAAMGPSWVATDGRTAASRRQACDPRASQVVDRPCTRCQLARM
jgi:hypothetical protein